MDDKEKIMINFDLKFNGRIRLWFEENKELKFKGEKIICKDYMRISNNILMRKIIIAEIFLPRGGRNVYGLLGVEYNPIQSDMLKVTVNSNNNASKIIFNNSLINKIESAYIGLPYEYSQYIINRIDSLYESKELIFKGELNFNYAAFAEVSSNGWIFSKLTDLLFTFLKINKDEINSDVIMKFLD
jgi:hypothetical protein